MPTADSPPPVLPGPAEPYREAATREKLPDAERRWFTRQGDEQKGPYTAEVLARSLHSGVLKRTSLVRAEDEPEWRPVHTFAALAAPLKLTDEGGVAPRGAAQWSQDPRDRHDPTTEGSYRLGFVAGFLGGIIGFVLVRVIAKGDQTKRGAALGFGVSLALTAVRLLLHYAH
jgi:hypothetical protein